MKITVIGCGRWGSFLAWYMKTLGNSVTLYGRSGSRSYEELKSTRKNEYLTLQDDIEFSCDLTYSLDSADTVIISIGAQSFPALAESIRQFGIEIMMVHIEDDLRTQLLEAQNRQKMTNA